METNTATTIPDQNAAIEPEVPFEGMKPLPFTLYTIAEAAKVLRLHRNTVEIAIRKGHLKAAHKGRKAFIHIDELERFAKRDIPSPVWRGGFPRRRRLQIEKVRAVS